MNPLLIIGIIILIPVALFALYIFIPFVAGRFVNPNKLYETDSPFFRGLLNALLRIGLFFSRVKIQYEGDEKVPSGRFLLIGNHRSNFDPLVTAVAMKKYNLSFISKKENLTMPVFGRIVRRACYMPLERDDPRDALTIINHSAKLIKNDVCSVGVYPEGKRSFTNELLPFHAGVLKIAQKANVPIVVSTIEGTELVRDRFPRKTRVTLRIIDVVSAEDAKAKRSVELGEELYAEMKQALGK
ncbi:MAG: 1-acyl-sn-glycerol-3-phosphate acyltransferase [Lachnospiraceae bacterium]|nr:1-acyl-sn-glycerol-3-phosphate acyltransferase [Lachnospiraceae bacterium]